MPSQPNQSLIDGLACLTSLAAENQPISGRQLARQLNLHHAKVNRLLMTLAQIGVVRQDERKCYRPAGGIHVLAALAWHGSDLLKRAKPILRTLHQEWPNASLAIGVLWQDHVAYLYHASLTAGMPVIGTPDLHPATESSIGQVLQDPLPESYAALIHEKSGKQHRSIAVPVYEYEQPIAGFAATNLPMDISVNQVVQRLHTAAAEISISKENKNARNTT